MRAPSDCPRCGSPLRFVEVANGFPVWECSDLRCDERVVDDEPLIPFPVVDHDNRRVTFAVTVEWEPDWAITHCEVIAMGRQIRTGLVDVLADSLAGKLVAVETWEPNEEFHVGTLVRDLELEHA